MMKTLSIIIPMYNAKEYIGSLLDSILTQNLPPEEFEILIINDGSKDHSEEIVNEYLKFPSIRMISQPNRGQSAARNLGIKEAMGKYLWFVDADDLILPNSARRVYDLALENNKEDPDIITFGIVLTTETSKPHSTLSSEPLVEHSITGIDYIANHNFNNSPCYYFIKKDYLISQNLFFSEGKLCEDGMFTLAAYLNSNRVMRIGIDVYNYIVRPNSTITSMDTARQIKLIDGFISAVKFIDEQYKRFYNLLSEKAKWRILERRDSYAVFLLIRLIRSGNRKNLERVIQDLKSMHLYPIKYMYSKKIIWNKLDCIIHILNNPLLSKACASGFNLLSKLKANTQ